MNSSTPTAAQRRAIEARAEGLCEYCRTPARYSLQSFESDHIVPVARGGVTSLSNLAHVCGGCNRKKGIRTTGIDPDSGQEVPLFHPRLHTWQTHFTWNSDFTQMIGLTAIGRATIQALQLNRPGLVNLRGVLVRVRVHPPQAQ